MRCRNYNLRAELQVSIQQRVKQTLPPAISRLGEPHTYLSVISTMAGQTGSSTTAQSLVDLYRLLGLEPLENDTSRITAVLKRALAKAKAAGDTPDAQRLTKLVALGQKFLLDAQRKADYDRQWKAAYGSQAGSIADAAEPDDAAHDAGAVAGVDTTAWDDSSLEALLPQGDPQAPFNMAEFVKASEMRDPQAAEADFAKLMSVLGVAVPASGVSAPVSGSAALVSGSAAMAPQVLAMVVDETPVAAEATIPVAPHLPSRKPKVATKFAPGTSNAEIAAMMRARRQRRFLMNSIGMVGVAVVLLSVALYMNWSSQPKPLSPDEQLALAQRNNQRAMDKAGLPRPGEPSASEPGQDALPAEDQNGSGKGRSSGLPMPGQGGVDTSEMLSQPGAPDSAPSGENASMPAMNADTPAAPAAPTPDPGQPNPAQPNTPMPNATPDEPAMAEAGKPVDAAKPDAAMAAQEPQPMSDPALTADDKAAWKKVMTQAKTQIGLHEFDKADKALEEAQALAKTALQREQLERLRTVHGLVKEFRDALVEAVRGLGPAEVIKVGSTAEASFVEGSDKLITVRLQGRQQKYAYHEMPMGLAFGLADLKLDIESASSKAKKGAYSLVHPKSNKMNLDRGKRLLTEAAQAGAVSENLPLVYDEDYSLKDLD